MSLFTNRETSDYLEIRKAIIKNTFSSLNNMQQKAVMATEGPLLILAGAGSGKTTVLINRIANLIQFGSASDSDDIPDGIGKEDVSFLKDYWNNPDADKKEYALKLCELNPVNPWNILAITFTNKAANELKERLNTMLGSGSESVWAMTFHSACCRILRKEIDRLGYDRSFTIYDTSDSVRVIRDVMEEKEIDQKAVPPKDILSEISKAKDMLIEPDVFRKEAEESFDYKKPIIALIYEEYQRRLREANAVDFDDIITLTVRLLREYEEVRQYYQNKFRYIMVDEYQDTNYAQYQLVSILAAAHHNICVVGDDDQSIYAFRGATIKNILGFDAEYKDARVIRLEQNYRSTDVILQAANAVIQNNESRHEKILWTDRAGGELIWLYEAPNQNYEGEFITRNILSGVGSGDSYRDYAVLYRNNAQSNAIEQSFRQAGIPYRIIGGTRFYDRAEVKDMIAYLAVVNNPSDSLRLKRIINNPPRGIGKKTIEAAERQAVSAGVSLYSVIKHPEDYPSLEKAEKKLKRFVDIIDSCRAQIGSKPLDELYDFIIEKSGYLQMLELKQTTENQTKADNVKELKSSIIKFISDSPDEPNLDSFLEQVSLYTDVDQYDKDADAAVMMTVHSAKGLEFKNVFLAGLEKNIFPTWRTNTKEDLEEERRLCYVAITRAKERLYLSYAVQRLLYGRQEYNGASVFLSEIPEKLILRKNTKTNNYQSYGEGSYFRNSRSVRNYSDNERGIRSREKLPDVEVGQRVSHKEFGEGTVIGKRPLNKDAILEIAFDTCGTKKFMLGTVAKYMDII